MEEEKEEEPTDEYEVAYNIVSCQELVLSMNEAKRRWCPATGSFFNKYLAIHEVNRSCKSTNGRKPTSLTRAAACYIWQNMNTFDHETIEGASKDLEINGHLHLDKVFHLVCQLIRSAYSDQHSIDVLETLDEDVVRAATSLFKILLKYHKEREPHPQKSISQEEFHKIEEYVQMIIDGKEYLQPRKRKNKMGKAGHYVQMPGKTEAHGSFRIESVDASTLTSSSTQSSAINDLSRTLQNRPKSVKSSQASLDLPHMLKQKNGEHTLNQLNCLQLNSQNLSLTNGKHKIPECALMKTSFNCLPGDNPRDGQELKHVQLNINEIAQLLPFMSPSYEMNTPHQTMDDTHSDIFEKKSLVCNHSYLLEGDGVQPPFSRASVAHYINRIKLKSKEYSADSLCMTLLEDNPEYKMSSQFTSGIGKILKNNIPPTNPGGDNSCDIVCIEVKSNDRDLSQYEPQKDNCLRKKLTNQYINKNKTDFLDRECILSHFENFTNPSATKEKNYVAQSLTDTSSVIQLSQQNSLEYSSQTKSGVSNDLQLLELETDPLKILPRDGSSDNSSTYMDVFEWSESKSKSHEKSPDFVPCTSIDSDEAFFKSSTSACSCRTLLSNLSDVLTVTFSSDRFKIQQNGLPEESKSFSHLGCVEGFHNNNCLIGLAILVLLGSVIPFNKLQNAVMSKVKRDF